MLMNILKFTLPVIVVLLLFPLYGPTNGISLHRTVQFVAQEGEHGKEQMIKLQADVFRGLWFSPDGSVIRKTYSEALLITGEGRPSSSGGLTGKIYRVGESIKSIHTGYYDTGTVFVSSNMDTVIVDISKNWNGHLAPAYVNGTYKQ